MPCTAGRCLTCPWGRFSDETLADLPVVVVDLSGRLVWWPPWFPFGGTAADLGGTRWLEWFDPDHADGVLRWIRSGCLEAFQFPASLRSIGGGKHVVRCCGERYGREAWIIGFVLEPEFFFSAPGRHSDMQQ